MRGRWRWTWPQQFGAHNTGGNINGGPTGPGGNGGASDGSGWSSENNPWGGGSGSGVHWGGGSGRWQWRGEASEDPVVAAIHPASSTYGIWFPCFGCSWYRNSWYFRIW
ncbi:hypothetical protein AB2I16_26500 (plasmid) [Escherichia coli]